MVSKADVDVSQLPTLFSRAKAEIAKCDRLDQCAEWANKAVALIELHARQMRSALAPSEARLFQAIRNQELGVVFRC